jgi:hypothetical protein
MTFARALPPSRGLGFTFFYSYPSTFRWQHIAIARQITCGVVCFGMVDRNGEARIQASIVEWVRTVAPGVLIFHIPNGGYRSKAEAARLKWTGVLAGVPDLAIIAPGGRAFFLEVKTATGRLSEVQREVIGRVCQARGADHDGMRH